MAKGYEEDKSLIRTDSPTVSKENLRLIALIATNNNWKIHTLDIKAAFLQGFPIDRLIYLKPPPEANTNKLWKLNIPVYGLCEASRAWYLKVTEELTKLGAINNKFDNAVFFWYSGNELQGILCCHVDDFFFTGNQLFHRQVISKIKSSFNLSKESNNTFSYIGLDITQNKESIIMHQNEYIKHLQPMSVGPLTHQRELSNKKKKDFKGLIGQIQWVSKQTRPDLSFATCILSTKTKVATTSDVRYLNKQLRKLQENATEKQLLINKVGNIAESTMVVYSDASHANLTDGNSQGGFIIFLVGESNRKGTPLLWKSHKLKRVVKSAMAAETMSLIEAAEHAMLVKALILEIFNLKEAVPIVCLSDNKSLIDAATSTKVLEDKRLHIDMCSLREMISNQDIKYIKWVSSNDQLADCLTKATASAEKLLQVMAGSIPFPEFM